MSGETLAGEGNPVAPAVSPPPDLRLRAELPRVVRLSRIVVWSLGGVAMIAVAFALGYALESSRQTAPPAVSQDMDARPSADGLAGLPSDYVGRDVPKLGPALPGDLGHSILKAQEHGKVVSSGEDRRAAQEIEAAIGSRLFVQMGERGRGTEQALPTPGNSGTQTPATPATDAQAGNRAFLSGQPDRATTSSDHIMPPASPYILQAGTVIAGALNTKISSDLPGQITGHVTQNVYDSPTGRFLLIPQGSLLFGAYNSGISFGQQRTQIIWTRLIFPNGDSLVLEKLPGADAIGQSGLSDGVNNHWGQLFKAALVTTLLSVGSEAGTSWNENNLMQAIRSGASNGFSMVGNRLIDRSLNVQPTLTDRPGLPFTVTLNRDLILKTWTMAEQKP
ncbi:TrbI/VirB10 family protein [Acidomonas methanolica]|uniref:Conjugal transfer protein TrbI n=1 Tax=Acidomonas methanolica NBRC 104435 TaxID=1231351 RepID=A0A023D264_ACIMT|nr:TrbI/VirB10 family protein [Acidomonas methanolica]TCS25108.1 type IV secretion system protein VirB10 [Acidomonas methanolica]GAJ27865.1 conjugal transfer protein TrbI [Acidomonas methanolica NBRC 104435]GBQ46124.1 conjugal transfer protein TrbI [Acidomonas methanolica]GEK99804.1 conjugal transfer protein TrbI [Acidomonas methanolica NBRC 104435]